MLNMTFAEVNCQTNMSELSSNNTSLTDRDYEILKEIYEDYSTNKDRIEEYNNSKNVEYNVAPNPVVFFLTENSILDLLQEGLCRLLYKIGKADSFYKQKTSLNGIDFLAEYLYNKNPKHPDRKLCSKYLFDMEWVQDILTQRPRPFYPFSLIWTQDYAATKIQAFYRGYLQRKQLEVQEVRSFWRYLKGNGDKSAEFSN